MNILEGLPKWKKAKDVSPHFAGIDDVYVSGLGTVKRNDAGEWAYFAPPLLPLTEHHLSDFIRYVKQAEFLIKRLNSGEYII